MRQKKQKYICIVMAALLLLCLLPMSYGFDVLARFLAMAAFAYLAYLENQNKNTDRMVVFIVLPVLFQPFAKIALGRTIWNIVDVVVAAYLIYLSLRVYRK